MASQIGEELLYCEEENNADDDESGSLERQIAVGNLISFMLFCTTLVHPRIQNSAHNIRLSPAVLRFAGNVFRRRSMHDGGEYLPSAYTAISLTETLDSVGAFLKQWGINVAYIPTASCL